MSDADVSLAALTDGQRRRAVARYDVLRAHLHDGVALGAAARAAGVPERTAQRWLAAWRQGGLVALAPAARRDLGARRLPAQLVELVEGLALRRPRPSTAHVHRQATAAAIAKRWPAPSYSTVRAIVGALDPGLLALAHDGRAAYRDRYELVYRRESERPNEQWQADHTQLDVLVLDDKGRPARPWLTVILDDHSRVVAGYVVFLEAPSALQTALALRHAIWRKADPAWPTCGLPDVLYTDHGSDFTSRHIEQVTADVHVRLVNSTPGVPQGRGKIERFFGTVTSELLPTLPGHLPHGSHGTPPVAPALTLAELDATLQRFVVHDYNTRTHSETGQPPTQRWLADGWLPRLPASLDELDLLLLTVARARRVHRDGIRFAGLRYLDLTLAAYVGEPVTIRYDPRDLAEIRVFHEDRYLCRAVSPELAATTISLRELQAARTARRRELKATLDERRGAADAWLPLRPAATASASSTRRKTSVDAGADANDDDGGLRLYREQ